MTQRVDPTFLMRQVSQTQVRLQKAIYNPMIVVAAPPKLEVHHDFKNSPLPVKELPAFFINGEPLNEMLYAVGQTVDNMCTEIEFLRTQVAELTRTNESLTRSNARWKQREDTVKERMRTALNAAIDNI